MSALSNHAENALLALIFNATAWANMADNAASSPHTTIGVALATADYTDTGTMSSNETTYTSYGRVNQNRNSAGSGWAVSGTNPTEAVPQVAISFPAGTGGSGTVTHFAVGRPSGGATDVFFYGSVSPSIAVGNGVTPQLTTATSIQLA
jgi:hypothetical protein